VADPAAEPTEPDKDDRTAWERFDDLARKVITTPKTEVEKHRKREEKGS